MIYFVPIFASDSKPSAFANSVVPKKSIFLKDVKINSPATLARTKF